MGGFGTGWLLKCVELSPMSLRACEGSTPDKVPELLVYIE